MTKEQITFGVGWEGGVHIAQEAELALLAESLGLDGVWVGDSPTNRAPTYDPHIVLASIAARTERVKLGTSIYLLPLSHPTRLAKQLATLDILSRGRVIVGVGPGGEFPKQYEAFGLPVSERGARTSEYIQVLRALWTQPIASFHGRFLDFEGIIMEPKPVQKSIPIWVGGRPGGVEKAPDGGLRRKSKTAALKRTALLGDGWLPYYMSVESYRNSVQQIRAIAQESGRDPSTIAMALNNFWFIDESFDKALERAYGFRNAPAISKEKVVPYDFLGTSREIVPKLEQFIDAGCRHFVCKLECSQEALPSHLDYLAREIAPHFR
ncbi:MAG: LLM class flavin-dependent oxidoreductase [Chloroflexi bacterium]|nr:LLM class flavin-dependent oxidoreductase [Chloroflexota bacterium]